MKYIFTSAYVLITLVIKTYNICAPETLLVHNYAAIIKPPK